MMVKMFSYITGLSIPSVFIFYQELAFSLIGTKLIMLFSMKCCVNAQSSTFHVDHEVVMSFRIDFK